MDQTFKTFIKDDNGNYVYRDYVPSHIITGDTDSVYIHLDKVFAEQGTNVETVVEFADTLGKSVNAAFPDFMASVFNCNAAQSKLIQTEREIVADKNFFSAKKNYMMHIVDKAGVKKDDYKIMGLAIRKSDTPQVVREFLKKMVLMVMERKPYDEIRKFIFEFKAEYRNFPLTEIGRPMNAKNIKKYADLKAETGKDKGVPYHMRAAMFYNGLCSASDIKIRSGDKMKIVYIKHPDARYLAVPADADTLPEFLNKIQIDWDAQWETVEAKIIAYLKPIGYDPESRQAEKLKGLIVF